MVANMKNYLKLLSNNLFNALQSDEELSLGLHSEESEFIRFTQSKVRQNTSVNQHELTLQFQLKNRTYKSTSLLSLDVKTDTNTFTKIIERLRSELLLIDENPKTTPMLNHGISEVIKKSQRPATVDVIKKINAQFSDVDLAGLYCAGPLRQASINSKGQFHYYESDHFFFDYSIYDGPRAAKGYYADEKWNDSDFNHQALEIKETLNLLRKPPIIVKPGAYRTYLAPMAVAELAQIFNWRAVSRGAYEQGFTPLKKLYNKENLLSNKFSLIENNELGLNSHFNSLGELSPKNLPVIENGELKNFLISTATAQEYGLESNNADVGQWFNEAVRSMDIRAGTLELNDILQQLDTGLFLTNLHYINWSDSQSARVTGMTRFACFWVESGEIKSPIQDLRFDDTLYNVFGDQLIDLTSHQSTYLNTSTYQKRSLGGMKVPGILLNRMNFTL